MINLGLTYSHYKKSLIKLFKFRKLSFDIFENECHATHAARLTPKTIFIFCIFEKEYRATGAVDYAPKYFNDFHILKMSILRHERSIRHQNYFYNFLY